MKAIYFKVFLITWIKKKTKIYTKMKAIYFKVFIITWNKKEKNIYTKIKDNKLHLSLWSNI